MNPNENASKSYKLPERYMKEGLTPFNLSMAMIACSQFKDSMDMLIAREDVYRKTLETDNIAIELIFKKAQKMEMLENQKLGFFSLYFSSEKEYNEIKDAIWEVQEEIRKGMHKKEQILIKQGVEENIKLLVEVGVPELCRLLKEHSRDLPVAVVSEWLSVLNFMFEDNIVLNTWAKSKLKKKKEYTHKDVFQAIADDVEKYGKEVESGISLYFDMLCSKAMEIYPERAQDIENELYNTDQEFCQTLIALTPQVREDIVTGNVAIYDPDYDFEKMTEAVQYIMGKLLWCYQSSVVLIRKNMNSIDFLECFELNKRIINNLNATYKLLDVFDAQRESDEEGVVTNMLTGFNYVDSESLS